MITRRAVATAIVVLTLLAGCGSNTDISARAGRQLQARLDEVRTAVAAVDRAGARAALKDLQRSVSELLAADQLSDGRAAEILAAAEDVAAQLSLLPAPEATTSPSPEPTETVAPAPSPKPHKSDEDKGEGGGKGKGKGQGHH